MSWSSKSFRARIRCSLCALSYAMRGDTRVTPERHVQHWKCSTNCVCYFCRTRFHISLQQCDILWWPAHLVNRWCQSLWADPWGLYSYELELLLGIQDKERHHGGYSFVRSRSRSEDRSCANIAVVQVWFSKCSHTDRKGYFFVKVVKQGFHIILEYHKRKKRPWVQIRLSKNLDLCVLLIKWLWNSNMEYTLSLKNPNSLSKSLISFSVGVNKSRKSMQVRQIKQSLHLLPDLL